MYVFITFIRNMGPEEFLKKINKSLRSGQIDNELLEHDTRFLRGKYLLKMIENVSRILRSLDFKDTLIFEDNIPYIQINGIKIILNHTLFLKHSGKKFVSQSLNTINFIKYIKLDPKIIIDLGACWGEHSLCYAKEFSKSKIYSIEGSPLNYSTLLKNLKINKKISQIIKPFNLIITDFDGIEEISNNLNTMNTIKRINNGNLNYTKVESKKLNTFIMDQNLDNIDFMKIDIEGAELELLNDLQNKFIKIMQIELINLNNIKDNLNFIQNLSNFYFFYHSKSFKKLSLEETQNSIQETLRRSNIIDLFLVNKRYNN